MGSETRHQYRYQHWHQHQRQNLNTYVIFTQYKSSLELKVLYILVKDIIVKKVANYRLGTCHFVRKYFWKCFDNLKKAAVQNPCRKHSALESFFNEIAEINFRPLVKKGLHQWGLPVNVLKLSAFLQEGLIPKTICSLYSKVVGWTVKELHHRIFSEKVFAISYFLQHFHLCRIKLHERLNEGGVRKS